MHALAHDGMRTYALREVRMTKFLPCDPEELRRTFLFEKLTDEQLDWLCREGHVEQRAGRPRCTPRVSRRACFYVLLDGEVALSRLVGGDDVETNRTQPDRRLLRRLAGLSR